MNHMDERTFLARLETEIEGVLADSGDALELAARHLLTAARAKRARPRLCFRFGQLCGTGDEELVAVAVAAELLHNASLLHDDVVDEGMERRGLETANRAYGNGVAVLAGDLLITVALERLKDLPRAVTLDGVRTVATMARAALLELDARGRADLDLAGWRRIAHGKTATLLGFCGRAAALAAGQDERAPRFGELAERFGVAFQMADDLADFESGTGKAALKDLRERTPGLPLVLATERDAALRADVKAAFDAQPGGLDPETAASLALRIADTGVFPEARRLLADEVAQATRLLSEKGESAAVSELLAFGAELVAPGYFVTGERAA